MLDVRITLAAKRANEWIISALAVLGWASSLALWFLADAVAGGINAVTWSLAWTGFVWVTAGSAMVILGHQRLSRRVL